MMCGAEDMMEVLLYKEITNSIHSFLATQAPVQKKEFELRYWDSFSAKEIGKQMGVSANRVSLDLFRMRNRLQTQLMLEGY